MRLRKRYLIPLALMLVCGFGLMLYGTEERVRSLQWQGIGLMLCPVLATGLWLMRRLWVHRRLSRRLREEAEETGRMIAHSGEVGPTP